MRCITFRYLTVLAAFSLLCAVPLFAIVERDYSTGVISLTLDGVSCGAVKEAFGGEPFGEAVNETLGTDQNVKKHFSNPRISPITLKFGLTLDRKLYEWIGDSWKTTQNRKNGAFTFSEAQAGMPNTLQFNNTTVIETTIPACDGNSDNQGHIILKLAPDSTNEVMMNTTGSLGDGFGMTKAWQPGNFRLEIDGVDCTRVAKIESFTVKKTMLNNPIGGAKEFFQEAVKLEFPNLVITLSDQGSTSWRAWRDDFIVNGNNGDDKEKNGRLIFLAHDLKTEMMRINLYNLGILKLERQSTSGKEMIKNLKAELYCERMELDASMIGSENKPAPAATDAAQIPNGPGEFGKVYLLRQHEPLHFSLVKAEYLVTPVKFGKAWYAPNASEKLLLLHYTVKNPGQREMLIRHDSLRFNAFDRAGRNLPAENNVGMEENGESMSSVVLPGQQVSLYSVITVPAKGEMPRLLVRSNHDNDGPDLPFDLPGKVAKLQAPFAEPADATGCTVRELVPAQLGENFYPYNRFSAAVLKMETVTESPLGDYTLRKGERFIVFHLLVRNQTPGNVLLRFDTFIPELLTGDDEKLRYNGLLFAATNRPVSQELRPGGEIKVRMYFTAPEDAKPSTLTIREGDSRSYIYRMSER